MVVAKEMSLTRGGRGGGKRRMVDEGLILLLLSPLEMLHVLRYYTKTTCRQLIRRKRNGTATARDCRVSRRKKEDMELIENQEVGGHGEG